MDRDKGLLFILGTALISGVSIFINKFAVTGTDPAVYAFLRSVIVSAILVGVLFATSNLSAIRRLTRKDWLGLAAVGLVGGSVPFLLFFTGLQLTTSASASFIQKTMFVFVAVLAGIFLKERIDRRMLAAAGLLLAGNFLLVNLVAPAWNLGSVLILAATVLWAVENVYSKRLLDGIEPNILASGRMFFGAVFILAYLTATGNTTFAILNSPVQLEWVVVTSIILAAYQFTWYNGLKETSVTAATAILMLGSPITTLLNYSLTGSAVSAPAVAGIIVIFAGAGLAAHSFGLFPLSRQRIRSG